MKHLLLFLCIAATSIGVSAQNLLGDSSFEADRTSAEIVKPNDVGGELTNSWNLIIKDSSAGDAETATGDAIDGLNSLSVNLTNIDYRYRFFLAQEVENVEVGKYVFSIWLKADVANMDFRMDALNQNIGNSNGTDITTKAFKTTTGWSEYTLPVTIASAEQGALVRFVVRFNCAQGGGITNTPTTYWLDNVTLTSKSASSSVQRPEASEDKVAFVSNGQVYIPSLTEVAKVSVYNMVGGLVASASLNPGGSLPLNAAQGIYIIKVESAAGTDTYKVSVK